MGRHSRQSNTLRNIKAVTVVAAAATVPAILAIPAHASTGILGAIEKCESGGNPTAQNPSSTASGAFQFLDSTWSGYGGYARAKDAPYALQLQKAETMPLSAWDASRSCWGGQTGTVSHAAASAPVVHHHAVQPAPASEAPIALPSPTRHLPAVHAPVHHYPTSGSVYHVVTGDTLSAIGVEHGIAWPALYDANREVIGGNPDLITPGQALKLP